MRLRLLVLATFGLLVVWPAAAAAEDFAPPPPSTIPPPPAAPSPPPSISGSAQVGGVLTGNRGQWGTGVTVTSRWLRCSAAANRCDPTGDTDLSFTVTAADVGFVIKLRVEGRNVLGGRRTVDASTATIASPAAQASAPRNATAPQIQGAAVTGQLLTAVTGTWTGSDPIAYSYAWASCAKGLVSCRTAATGTTYRVQPADAGRVLLLAVGATNAVGASVATAQTGPVTVAIPALKRLSPFPTLLIDGRVAGAVTSISTLRLRRVPGGSAINLSCTGRGCPFRKSSVKVRRGKSTTVTLRRLQRRMRAGTTVVITVRKGNTLGKYIRLRFRKGSAPARVDRCVAPKSPKPLRCP